MTTKTNPVGLRLNLWLLSITRNWMRIVLTILAVYVALPFIAPTLMKLGIEGPARVIYTVYRPFCHQMGFRTFHLYGEQPVYPLAPVAQLIGVESFESYVGKSPTVEQLKSGQLPTAPFSLESQPEFYGIDIPADITPQDSIGDANFVRFQLAAMSFVGNDEMGYKMTLCMRDISIYGTMLLFGIIYSRPVVRRRLRPVPLLLYFWLGAAPIAIDGFSQLLGYPPANFWAARETLPFFRILTGICFGGMTAWLGFPYIEMSMQDARREIEAKLAARGIKIR